MSRFVEILRKLQVTIALGEVSDAQLCQIAQWMTPSPLLINSYVIKNAATLTITFIVTQNHFNNDARLAVEFFWELLFCSS